MNTFSSLPLLTILFLFRGHLSEEKKLPGKCEDDSCSNYENLKGKCPNFCQGFNKTAQNYCTVDNYFGEHVEKFASCHCTTVHDAPRPSECQYRCLTEGCSHYQCDDKGQCGFDWECDDGSTEEEEEEEEEKFVAKRTLVDCSEEVALGVSCDGFCSSWEKGASSFCVVEDLEADDVDDLVSCYCWLGPDPTSVEEVYDCLMEGCRGEGRRWWG